MVGIRKMALSLLIAAAATILAPAAYGQEPQAAETVSVFFNDEPLVFHVDPLIENGTTLVEFRPLFERIGLDIRWHDETRTIAGTKDGLQIELAIGSREARVNGRTIILDAAPKIVGDRAVVPLRFVGEAAGSDVRWNGATRTIHLYHIGAESLTTDTNTLHLSGRVNALTRWVRFDVTKENADDTRTAYAEAKNGQVEHELYLHDGPGMYTVVISQTISADRNSRLYRDFATIRVENRGYSGIHIKESESADSKITVIGQPPEDIQSALLVVTRDETDEKKQVLVGVTDGHIEQPVYLNFGQGKYTINVYTSDEKLGEAREFEYYKSIPVINRDPRDRYLVPSEFVESEHPEIVQLALELTREKSSDAEKSRAIHDWVIHHIDYDAATYLAGGNRHDSALETLRERLTDCDGYARLNAALHRAAGIPAKVVIGALIDRDAGETWDDIEPDTVNHAWNEVYIDGRWVIQDPTLNAGYIDPDAGRFVRSTSHKYYDPSPATFALDHRETRGLEYIFE